MAPAWGLRVKGRGRADPESGGYQPEWNMRGGEAGKKERGWARTGEGTSRSHQGGSGRITREGVKIKCCTLFLNILSILFS
jgi:hypothetical protein